MLFVYPGSSTAPKSLNSLNLQMADATTRGAMNCALTCALIAA
jgi:hypothetical protein